MGPRFRCIVWTRQRTGFSADQTDSCSSSTNNTGGILIQKTERSSIRNWIVAPSIWWDPVIAEQICCPLTDVGAVQSVTFIHVDRKIGLKIRMLNLVIAKIKGIWWQWYSLSQSPLFSVCAYLLQRCFKYFLFCFNRNIIFWNSIAWQKLPLKRFSSQVFSLQFSLWIAKLNIFILSICLLISMSLLR